MTRRWAAVARKDFADAIRSRTLLAFTVIYALLLALIVATPGLFADDFPPAAAIYLVAVPTGIVVPLLALVASYLAVAGERESGTLKLLLGLPPTRRDVVIGKLVGRTVVVLTSLLAAFAIGAVLLAAVYGSFPFGAYVRLALVTGLLSLSFVGLAVGLSAASGSRSGAMTPAIGVYLLFVVLWDLVVGIVPVAANWVFSVEIPADVVGFLSLLSPARGYNQLINSWVVTTFAGGVDAGAGQPAQGADPTAVPLDLPLVAVVALMLAWVLVPVALGYWRFERADLA